jgi:hypothetical protein
VFPSTLQRRVIVRQASTVNGPPTPQQINVATKLTAVLIMGLSFPTTPAYADTTLRWNSAEECVALWNEQERAWMLAYHEQASCWVNSRCRNPGLDPRFTTWSHENAKLHDACMVSQARENKVKDEQEAAGQQKRDADRRRAEAQQTYAQQAAQSEFARQQAWAVQLAAQSEKRRSIHVPLNVVPSTSSRASMVTNVLGAVMGIIGSHQSRSSSESELGVAPIKPNSAVDRVHQAVSRGGATAQDSAAAISGASNPTSLLSGEITSQLDALIDKSDAARAVSAAARPDKALQEMHRSLEDVLNDTVKQMDEIGNEQVAVNSPPPASLESHADPALAVKRDVEASPGNVVAPPEINQASSELGEVQAPVSASQSSVSFVARVSKDSVAANGEVCSQVQGGLRRFRYSQRNIDGRMCYSDANENPAITKAEVCCP